MVASSLRAALEAGLTPGQFWALTPYETRAHLEAATQRRKSDYRLAMWQGWHTAALYRAKKMPKLDRMLKKLDRDKRKKMSPDQMWKAFQFQNAAMGGKDNRAKKDG